MSATNRVYVAEAADFEVGTLKAVDMDGQSIVVGRTAEGFCAVVNQCSHMPLALAGGKLEGDVITCPFHGSKYNMCTGENIDWVTSVAGVKIPGWSQRLLAMGKQPQGVQSFAVVEDDGKLYIER